MLKNLFEKEAVFFETGGNKPFLLNENDFVWMIDSGKVDLFSVQVENGDVTGPRSHLFRAKEGTALLGMDQNFYKKGSGLLAVSVKGTRLMRLKKSRLKELSADPVFGAAICGMIDQWIHELSLSVIKTFSPASYETLEADKDVLVQEKHNARPKTGILWIKHIKGSFTFIGNDSAVLEKNVFFPLTNEAWVKSVNSGKLYALHTKDYIRQDPLWAGLEQFNRLILDSIIQNRQKAYDKELKRVKLKTDKDKTVFKNVLSMFATILEHRDVKSDTVEGEKDPLLEACRLIGSKTGINFKTFEKKAAGLYDPLDNIVRASSVRTRQVILKGEWWKHDNGPLLAFMKKDQRPVALLPVSARAYALHDPSDGTKIGVDQKIAESVTSLAYMFYRSFPERPLAAWDLVRIGLYGWKKDLLIIILMGICGALLGLIAPVATGIIIDTVIPEASRSRLVQIVLILLASVFAVSLFDFTKAIAMLRLKGKIDPCVEAGVVNRMITLPVPFFRKYNTGDLAGRCMGACAISQTFSDVTLQTILAGIFSFFNFILLFWYDRKLALLAAAIAIVGIVCTSISGLIQVKYQRKLNEIEGKISGIILQFITGITKLRVSGSEDKAFAVWAGEFNEKKTFVYKTRFVGNILESFNSSFPILASAAIFAWVAIISMETFTTGNFLAFNAAYTNFQNALLQMSMALVSIVNVVPLYERARPILETTPEVDLTKAHPGELCGEIEISHVKFRYEPDGPLTIDDVSLHIRPGEFVALVGSSGSGKTTLLRLLLGFEEAESGTIYYDGQDITTINIQEVRRQIGVVLQDGSVMTGDIFRNIVGTLNLTIDDAWEAARMAGLDEDIKEMPMMMHTLISAGGFTLSGGQRQRLLIARAIVHKPRVVFFDEATSALDNRTQAIVSRSLDNIQASRVVIAHRLSTIINADKIVVVDKGKIVQKGTYEELIGQDGLFADLAKRQIA